MNLRFRTNLDEAKGDVDRLNDDRSVRKGRPTTAIPHKGDLILFRFERVEDPAKGGFPREFTYHLEVCSVEWDLSTAQINIELYIPSYFKYATATIAGWTKWFKKYRFGKDY